MEVNITMGQNNKAWELEHAFLVYTIKKSAYEAGKMAFITQNPVRRIGDDQEIGPGKPVSVESILRLLQRGEEKPEFINDKILYRSRSLMAWWLPPHKRTIFFNCGTRYDLNGPIVDTPHPGLVFCLNLEDRNNPLLVGAVTGETRPDPETRMFYAPYFNIWQGGRVCHGNAPKPNKESCVESLGAWENAFFSSAFSHPNYDKVVKGNVLEFWRKRQGKKLAKFPESSLVSMGNDLDTWVRGATRDGR